MDLRSGLPNGGCHVGALFRKTVNGRSHPYCWLAPQIERYVEWMVTEGYAIRNIYRRVPMLCRFAEFAKRHGSTDVASAASQIEAFASHWEAVHAEGRAKEVLRKIAGEARNPVRQMLRLALEGRVTIERKHKSFPCDAEARDSCDTFTEERGLRPATIYHYIHRLHGFGDYLQRAHGLTGWDATNSIVIECFLQSRPRTRSR
jgi:integrase/recombinase XerD